MTSLWLTWNSSHWMFTQSIRSLHTFLMKILLRVCPVRKMLNLMFKNIGRDSNRRQKKENNNGKNGKSQRILKNLILSKNKRKVRNQSKNKKNPNHKSQLPLSQMIQQNLKRNQLKKLKKLKLRRKRRKRRRNKRRQRANQNNHLNKKKQKKKLKLNNQVHNWFNNQDIWLWKLGEFLLMLILMMKVCTQKFKKNHKI